MGCGYHHDHPELAEICQQGQDEGLPPEDAHEQAVDTYLYMQEYEEDFGVF